MHGPDRADAVLRTARTALAKAFRPLAKSCRPGPGEEAILSHDGACLHVTLGGMTVAVPAEGVWQGQARVPGGFILTIAKVMPVEDPVTFAVRGGYLRVGTSSMRCAWQSPWTAMLDMPINATVQDYLALRQTNTNEEIMQSGLSGAVKHAELERDKAVAKALKILAGLGVTESDIRRMIDERARQSRAT